MGYPKDYYPRGFEPSSSGSQGILNFKTLGEAMRPEKSIRKEEEDQLTHRMALAEARNFRLSREERDHIAGHALDSVCTEAQELARLTHPNIEGDYKHLEARKCSGVARKITALSNLLGDIGWERDGQDPPNYDDLFFLGELFPVAQLRPWLEEWLRQDNEALEEGERALKIAGRGTDEGRKISGQDDARARKAIAEAQTKLGTGAILLARIEKWMASHEN
jgi:hypothetical protein